MNDNEWSLPSYGITFNTFTPDDTGCTYLVTEDSGWRGGASTRPVRDTRPSSMGEFRRPNYSSGLVAVLEGSFVAPNATARSAAERKLAAIGRNPDSLFEVRGADALGELFSYMELDGKSLVAVGNKLVGSFSFQFASPDPRRYAVGATIGGSTGQPSSTGGLDWVTGGGLNWVPGLDWGTVTSTGQILFANTGTAPTDPVFTISLVTGTLVNPTVTLTATGQRLQYAATMTAGDTLRIDTSEFTRSVVLNGGQDVRTRLSVAEWFQIPSGTHAVSFTADNTNATATLSGTAFNAYW